MRSLSGESRSVGETELLDGGHADAALVQRSLDDVAIANTLLGGTRAVLAALKDVLADLPPHATLLDAGTGAGDIPQRVRAVAAEHGITLHTIGLDALEIAARKSQHATQSAVCGDVRALPFADHSVDLVLCSQVLHHFPLGEAGKVLRELDRVARVRVIVSDLHRARLAQLGIWASSFLFGFHPISRRDGMISVRRGFTPTELADYVRRAVGQTPVVHRRLGYRLTATWTPRPTYANA